MSLPLLRSAVALCLVVIATGVANAAEPDPASPAPPCTDSSPKCLQRIAQMYLDALVSHDGSKLPLAKDVRRSENALTNARGAYEVRESFVRTNMIEGVRDVRFFADGAKGEVVVYFRVDIDLKTVNPEGTTRAGSTDYQVSVSVPPGTYTVHESERFKIVKGYITEIEIIAHVEKGKGMGSGWPAERRKTAADKVKDKK